MYIKKLNLLNFQKHSELNLDFVNGVNIIFGSSDAGKSCIRRAIEWVVQNENIDGIRKTGTKQTSVCIILDNGIEIERVRSQTINRYILRKNNEEKVFDSIGKNIPEEIKEALTIYPIEVDGEEIYLNSQPQISLPFLFDKSPSFRMKLFNKLTGNDVLDVLFGQFNKDILRIKRDNKEETTRFEERAKELKKKEIEKEKVEAIYKRLKSRVEKVKELYEKYSKLVELKELQEKNISNLQNINKEIKTFKIPQSDAMQQLKEKIDRFDTLKSLQDAHEKVELGLNRVRGQLKDYHIATLNIDELTGKINRLDTLKTLKEKFDKNKEVCYTINRDIKVNLKEVDVSIINYKKLLKEIGICPICKGYITDDCLKEIKL